MEDLSMIDIEEIKEKKFELCERGISINKDGLTLKEEEELRKDLRVKPFVPPTSIQMQQSVKDFLCIENQKHDFMFLVFMHIKNGRMLYLFIQRIINII